MFDFTSIRDTYKIKREVIDLSLITSSLGQFLFYRPVRTVTGLIMDEEEQFLYIPFK